MKILTLYFLLLSSTVFGQIKQRDSIWSVEDISNITVYLYQTITDTTGYGGTGTIINHKQKFYLITAQHVAKEMKNNSNIVFRTSGDKPGILNIIQLTKNKLDWIIHPEADLALIELFPFNNDTKQRLQEWSFPSTFIHRDRVTMSRDNDVTFFGYPLLDLDLVHFSTLSFTAYLSSGFITNKRYDIQKKCTFFYLDQPSMQGCSGGGVFASVKKAIYYRLKNTIMLGIVHGIAGDETGGKLAAITPSFYIWDILPK